MKSSELKQLIREEAKKVLKEHNNPVKEVSTPLPYHLA
jgi:hypothetical protein